jgi:hypothetical protein
MMFVKDEKVFSLTRTADTVPRGDLALLFQEFYCYLLVAGLFREGSNEPSTVLPLSSDFFSLPAGAYNRALAGMISKGLKERYDLLSRDSRLSDVEKRVLDSLNAIFTNDTRWFASLTGRHLISIAYARQFSEPMKTVAHYVAVAFGQSDYPEPVSVPRLYLSKFGNIHLATNGPVNEEGGSSDRIVLDSPLLRYGSVSEKGDVVTALWSLLSAQIVSLTELDYGTQFAGDYLGDLLESYAFLTNLDFNGTTVPMPIYATSLYLKRLMGIDDVNPVNVSASFYRSFLYNNLDKLSISRQTLLMIIINLMMEKMGEPTLDHLFSDRSFYRNLTRSTLSSQAVKRPALFQFALEALSDEQTEEPDPDTNDTKQEDDPNSSSSQDSTSDGTEDPETASGGYDPSTPPPTMPVNEDAVDKDTIDLISFNKTGEGVNEDLYRQAVVALNTFLQNDDTVPVSSETKDALNYWVNGFLYRTNIQATQDQIKFLNLQTQLKNISTKG